MGIELSLDKYPFTILLISDTHFYREKQKLPVLLTERFRNTAPDLILHCGDICTMSLLRELAGIAPVYAVRGNRDIKNWFRLPGSREITVNGFRICMAHGEGNLPQYLISKVYFAWQMFRHRPVDFQKVTNLKKERSAYDLYCFGHTHSRFLEMEGMTLMANPGYLFPGAGDPFMNLPSYYEIRVDEKEINVRVHILEEDGFHTNECTFPRTISDLA